MSTQIQSMFLLLFKITQEVGTYPQLKLSLGWIKTISEPYFAQL